MRASRKDEGTSSRDGTSGNIHISGAEGIFDEPEISKVCAQFIGRALNHSRGKPDKVILTIEEISERPLNAALLPVRTFECASPDAAWELIISSIQKLGISTRAVETALKVLKSERPMRGAALIAANSGRRMEPDRERGVRVSRLGIDKPSKIRLSRRLSALRINTPTVREALILASKVASCKDISAEICISDDPDYTTGYIASRSTGYLRITNIKNRGGMNGGRVFFIRDGSEIENIIAWLERQPVIVQSDNE